MLNEMNGLSRRDFVAGLLATTGVSLGQRLKAEEAAKVDMKVLLFSKHLQWLDYERMSAFAAQVGLNGLDLTVRPGGHVEPGRVREDLPRAVEAMKKAGLTVEMMTTAIVDPDDPLTETILSTAARCGFKQYRMGYFTYDAQRTIDRQLEEWRPVFKDLAAMNRALGLQGAYQNHAGESYLGAGIWDLWEVIKGVDPQELGCQFDIRHATVEGGQCWPVDFRRIAPHITSLVAKDFYWERVNNKWTAVNCPLGRGMVDFVRYFKMVREIGFSGPVSLHLEYELGGAEHGRRDISIPESQVFEAIRGDLEQLKHWLEE